MAEKVKVIHKGNGSAVKEQEILEPVPVKVETKEVELPVKLQDRADQIVDAYLGFLEEQNEAFKQQMLARQTGEVAPEAGGPIEGGIQYWNVFTRGPYQLDWDQYYTPTRIVPAGHWAMLVGIVWINPVDRVRWALAGRQCRIAFETINLTEVIKGPGMVRYYTFPNSANLRDIYEFRWYFRADDPGESPNLFESTLTADLTMDGMPFAAFSTWHQDPESHLGIPGETPTVGPHWHHDIPARYMVYRERL